VHQQVGQPVPRSDFQCEHLFLRCLADMILTIGDHPITHATSGRSPLQRNWPPIIILFSWGCFPCAVGGLRRGRPGEEFGLNLLDAKTV
jgi:hypothetical protein